MSRYDPDVGRWVRVSENLVPFFMRRPQFTSPRTPATFVYLSLTCLAVLTLVSVFALSSHQSLLNDRANGLDIPLSEIDDSRRVVAAIFVLQIVTTFVVPLFFLWWVWRIISNLPALGVASPQFTPGWTIAWFFIPIASLFQPCRALMHAWRASSPDLPADSGYGYKYETASPLIVIFWLLWLLVPSLWIAALGEVLNDTTETWSAAAANVMTAIVASLGWLVVILLALAVVHQLTEREERANEKFDLRSGAYEV